MVVFGFPNPIQVYFRLFWWSCLNDDQGGESLSFLFVNEWNTFYYIHFENCCGWVYVYVYVFWDLLIMATKLDYLERYETLKDGAINYELVLSIKFILGLFQTQHRQLFNIVFGLMSYFNPLSSLFDNLTLIK